MPNYAKLIDKLVTNAFDKQLTPGGLTEEVTFRFFVSEGVYDVESDTTATEWNDVPEVMVVASRPSFDDKKDHGLVAGDMKLILPASKLPSEPQTDTDKVLRADGLEWDVRKTVGVPGEGIYMVFIYLT